MARLTVPLFLLFSAVSISIVAAHFIEDTCKEVTLYPEICIKALSGYANTIQDDPKKLAQTALTVSLDNTKSATALIAGAKGTTTAKGKQAVRDCVQAASNAGDRLSRAIKELELVKGRESVTELREVQTLVSDALTDVEFCLNKVSAVGGNVKDAAKEKFIYAVELAQNTLSLVNKYAAKYEALFFFQGHNELK